MKHFVGVGACYLDTILRVPHFVIADEKLRASGMVRRRGENCLNTIEVLQQLLALGNGCSVTLELVSTFPERLSSIMQKI
ncbi:hypothetical protein HD806DRAFT_474852 [Xylariaceae sp. AK1471]|nr:hypothetical protein HD806DRAFT_474852 [Xylariaceae sp. AK1471]